jgi:hypothetical protein
MITILIGLAVLTLLLWGLGLAFRPQSIGLPPQSIGQPPQSISQPQMVSPARAPLLTSKQWTIVKRTLLLAVAAFIALHVGGFLIALIVVGGLLVMWMI